MAESSYTVLARRYRPVTFDEVVGQEHVARTLKNAIAEGRVGHAYLFAGPRGVGKTSTARILARALDCEKGPTSDPCGACEICRSVHDGTDADVVEMDAASNRGVDDARALREGVRYAPLRARFKIYIIDEAHMLTKEAFNTLLKTLEEPPPHVKFVFATTEIHKLPDTIISRCQRFDFRRITTADIVKRLRQVIEREKLDVDPAVLEAVARAGRGSMRDAESILDQLVAYKPSGLKAEDVAALQGSAAEDDVNDLVRAARAGAADGVLLALDRVFARGIDPASFADQILEHYRALLAIRVCGASSPVVDLPDGMLKAYEEQVAGAGVESLLYALQILLEARRRLREGAAARLVLEVALVKVARAADLLPLSELLRMAPVPAPASPSADVPAAGAAGVPASPPAPEPAGESPANPWARVVTDVKGQNMLAGTLLGEGAVTKIAGEELEFTLPAKFAKFHVEQLESAKNRAVIEGAVHRAYGKRYVVSFRIERGGEKTPPSAPAKSDATSDPRVRKVMDMFGGKPVGIE
ncbi:MAG: DNA polymerase III subunit gamma/tau [Planctomycetes bacterium]|nr:DNA polymerase III subunit gamma/tau [Planctomycetota bacterium]